nr:hypothetical protein CFP56_19632 [Quercus suber]
MRVLGHGKGGTGIIASREEAKISNGTNNSDKSPTYIDATQHRFRRSATAMRSTKLCCAMQRNRSCLSCPSCRHPSPHHGHVQNEVCSVEDVRFLYAIREAYEVTPDTLPSANSGHLN